MIRTRYITAALVLSLLGLASCAVWEAQVDDLDAAMSGRSATLSTYDQDGNPVDLIHGASIQVQRESQFDSSGTSSDGVSIHIPDSEFLRISIGEDIMRHVGSTLLVVEDGVNQISEAQLGSIDIDSLEPGTPFLNQLFARFENSWDGGAKTVLIRSQDAKPITVLVGDSVEIFATDIPKSTRIQIDGRYALIYRADITIYDTELLAGATP